MLNFNRTNLIKAIETVGMDSISTIEWNLELIDADLSANRGSDNGALVTAYQLIATQVIEGAKQGGRI
jgi:hypothetical protein